MPFQRFFICALALALSLPLAGCMTAYRQSMGSDSEKAYRRIFLTDYNTAWQSVIDALKTTPLDISNRDGGYIRTKWTDNTAEKNFIDAFAGANAYLKAEYRFRVTVQKGFYNGQPSVKVGIQKDQRVQRDVLEGWRPMETDAIDENTLLYRIGRIISIKMKISAMEEEKTKKELESVEF